MFKRMVFVFLICLCPLSWLWAADGVSSIHFQTRHIKVGQKDVRVEVAKTEMERQQGLMFRKSLKPDEGMLFVFGSAAHVCMWMKNTLIPLSVAFVDREGMILNIEDMQPMTLESHCGRGAVWYALEMNQGWFRKHQVGPGMRLQGLPQ